MGTGDTAVDDVGDMGTGDGGADDVGAAAAGADDAVTRAPVVWVLLQALPSGAVAVTWCWL